MRLREVPRLGDDAHLRPRAQLGQLLLGRRLVPRPDEPFSNGAARLLEGARASGRLPSPPDVALGDLRPETHPGVEGPFGAECTAKHVAELTLIRPRGLEEGGKGGVVRKLRDEMGEARLDVLSFQGKASQSVGFGSGSALRDGQLERTAERGLVEWSVREPRPAPLDQCHVALEAKVTERDDLPVDLGDHPVEDLFGRKGAREPQQRW
jgi:hypothetical protein